MRLERRSVSNEGLSAQIPLAADWQMPLETDSICVGYTYKMPEQLAVRVQDAANAPQIAPITAP
jgi:hypothetical protein